MSRKRRKRQRTAGETHNLFGDAEGGSGPSAEDVQPTAAVVGDVDAPQGESPVAPADAGEAWRAAPASPAEELTDATPKESQAQRRAPAAPDPLAHAKALVSAGRLEEAIAAYREIVADHPDNLKARNNLGLLYEGVGLHERALEQFESARVIAPDHVTVLSNLAGALLNLGRFEDAERELRRALKLDPESVEVRANIGTLYFRRGQYALAENELKWVCEQDSGHAQAFFYRGEALNRLGRVDKALDVLERAAALQPSNAKIYHTMGMLFDKKNMPAQAAQMYRKVRELTAPRPARWDVWDSPRA